MTDDDIHNLFIETVMKAKDNPVSDHTHSISPPISYPPNYGQHNHGIGGFGNQPLYYDPNVQPGRMYSIGGNIYANPNDHININGLTNAKKEPEMSTIEKIKAERKEKRERDELEAKFEAWEAAIGSAAHGDIYAFTLNLSNKLYHYAAIFTDGKWFLTGAVNYGMATEDFIAWLIEKDAEVGDMVFMEPLT